MNIQIIGTKKCKETQKTLRFFKERGIKPHFVNLIEKSLSKGELNNISNKVGLDNLIDTEGKEFERRQLKYKVYSIETEILENPLLLKTPIVRFEKNVCIGYQPETLKKWIIENKIGNLK